MIDKSTRLGPFEIGECIGQGGMGKVFRGVHARTGVTVAVKVILGQANSVSKGDFHREVQAQAGLAHPGVVYLFDYGTVDEEAARALDGGLDAGSPYVAMELAEAGTVLDHMPFDNWQSVRQVLLQVLDALAFAHAREVIHRDLKPENLLVFETDHGERRIKLADFGLAHAFGHDMERSEESLAQVAGTPYYMAPEQFSGAWRAYGPWTDIYSLGCVAWHLICGRPPYVGNTFFAIAVNHCGADIPALEPLFAIPDGVEEWIQTAMATAPQDRFQRASDAAWALPKGGGGHEARSGLDAQGRDGVQGQAETMLLETLKGGELTRLWSADSPVPTTIMAHPGMQASAVPGLDGPRATPVVAPVPLSWQTVRQARLPEPLVGAGLGLFGLRAIPFVDRDAARDRIWQALRDVAENNELQVVFVVGDAGVGKSRLVHWMATRAHEVGAAEVLRAVHTRGGRGPTEGLAGLVQRAFHTWKLSRARLYDELLKRLPPLDELDSFREIDARALTEIVHPTEDDNAKVEGPRYRFTSSRQKYALIRRLVIRFARHRTPVLWLDDLHDSAEGLGLIEYLLSLPVENRPASLILATLRADVLAEDGVLSQRVARIVDHESCHGIDLEAIGASDHRQLIELMLPLSPELAESLGERTEGNPLFAHQLLSDWIFTDGLEISEHGFRVVEGKSLSLPDDIHELWMERVDRLLECLQAEEASQAEVVFELAAALGREVDQLEWHAVCAQAHLVVPAGLEDALFERGLAARTQSGWAFTHGLLVDSLERRARQADRWRGHHRHCAKMLEARYPDQPRQTARRRAEHWLEANEFEHALEPLHQAIQHLFTLGESTQWQQLVRLGEELLDRLGKEPHAPQRLNNDLLASRILFFENKPQEAIALVEDILLRCQEIDDDVLLLRAHQQLATVLTAKGDFEEALRELEVALNLAIGVKDEYWLGMVTQDHGNIWFLAGELERAEACTLQAMEHFRASGAVFDDLRSKIWRGWIQLTREDYQACTETFESALAQASRQGFRLLESQALNGLGDIARFCGEFAQARGLYEKARQIDREMADTHGEITSMLNLAQVELAFGHFERGHELLEISRSLANTFEGGQYAENFDCAELLLVCGGADWSRAHRILDKFATGWPQHRPVWRDHVWLLELAAGQAEDAGKLELAGKIWHLAGELWEKLANEEAAMRARERVVSLQPPKERR